MTQIQSTVSYVPRPRDPRPRRPADNRPIDQSIVVQRPLPADAQLDAYLEAAVVAQKAWQKVALDERIAIGRKFVREFAARGEQIGRDLTTQMGRPSAQGLVEVHGTVERAERMLDLAGECLADVVNPVSRRRRRRRAAGSSRSHHGATSEAYEESRR